MLRQIVEGKKFVRRIIKFHKETDKQHGGNSEESLGPHDQAQTTCQGL